MRSKLHNLKASQGASRSLGTATTPGRNSVPGALRSGTSNVPSLREGARLLAVSRLKAASEAAGRLTGKQDSEALHDFRVNLRRLRVCLRSYRGVLGGAMPLRAVKRAKKIARLTAVARDVEVFSRWIESWEKFIKPDEKPGVEAFRCWLNESKNKKIQAQLIIAKKKFTKLASEFKSVLPSDFSHLKPGDTFLSFSAPLARRAAKKLNKRLSKIKAVEDDKAIHKARIAGKKLRYLMEPFDQYSVECKKTIARLKRLQDILGVIHDLNLIRKDISRCSKKEKNHSLAPGFLKLARLANSRRDVFWKRWRQCQKWGQVLYLDSRPAPQSFEGGDTSSGRGRFRGNDSPAGSPWSETRGE